MLYLDLQALRRLLWSSTVLLASLPAPDSTCVPCGGVTRPQALVALSIAVLVEAAAVSLSCAGVSGTYVGLRCGVPVVQFPPVVRASGGWRGAALLAAVTGGAVAVAWITCTPWSLVAGAIAVWVHALLLLFPAFGRHGFWRLHYWGEACCGGATPFEEWFCSAAVAVQVTELAHKPLPKAVLVVGSGLSAVPAALAARGCDRVVAVDVSRAAVGAMRARCPEVEWHESDCTDLRVLLADGSMDAVVDKGTYAALLERSASSCGAGFAEARRVLRPGTGVLVTIALVPLSPRRLRACGFERLATYRLPLLFRGAPEVFAQVARRIDSDDGIDAAEAFAFEGGGYDEHVAAVNLPALPTAEAVGATKLPSGHWCERMPLLAALSSGSTAPT